MRTSASELLVPFYTFMCGAVAGFEPPTSRSESGRSTQSSASRTPRHKPISRQVCLIPFLDFSDETTPKAGVSTNILEKP